MENLLEGFQWWVAAVEVPVISGLFWILNRYRKEADDKLDRIRSITETNYIQVKEALSGYKLEVAKSYASINSLKEVEKRLVEHLLRIEEKL